MQQLACLDASEASRCLSNESCSSDSAYDVLEKHHLKRISSILKIKLHKSYLSCFCLPSAGRLEAHKVKELWAVVREWALPNWQKRRNNLVESISFCLLQASIPHTRYNNFKYWLHPLPPLPPPPANKSHSTDKAAPGCNLCRRFRQQASFPYVCMTQLLTAYYKLKRCNLNWNKRQLMTITGGWYFVLLPQTTQVRTWAYVRKSAWHREKGLIIATF